ncbi:MAG: Oligopeptide ABC transporter, periplasmic oligopeptide-binding protein OppA [Firmicutes bacterium]|nr:Oligopeptide ABC transporter, periplasmic oligopeptide-binding protein OppA [Bacillota bacterium]
MKSKELISMLLIFVLAVSLLTACSGQGAANDASQTKKLLFHVNGNTPYINLDPSVENSNGVMILQNCYEMLTYYNYETGKIEPMLSESWSTSEDSKSWTFTVKKGVKFHDGAELNAEAVKKSIDRTMELGLGASFIWDSVESIEVVSDYEVKFNLKYPAPIDLIASAAYAAFIISPNAVEQDSDWFNQGNSAGTGPYKIQKAVAGEEIVLERFDDYRKGWKDNQYDTVVVKKVPESSARRQLLEKGEAQLSANFSTTDIQAMKKSDTVQIVHRPLYDTVVGCLNTEKYPLNNVDFRRALSYAFPYEETVDKVLEGQGVQSHGLIPSGLWGHSEDLMQYTCDLDKAKEYLDKSGVQTKGLTLEMTISAGYDEYRNFAQLYQINLKKLGINLEIREMSWDTQWEKGKNPNPKDRQDIFLFIWWPDYPSPISWFEGMVRSEDKVFFNLSYIKNPGLDAKIQEASTLTVTDRDKAEQIIIDMQKEIIDQAYFLHLYDKSATYAINKDIQGFTTNPAYPTVVRYYELHQ